VAQLERALDIYTDCGAGAAAERVRRQRAQRGVPSSEARPRSGSARPLRGLSPTQSEVARWVAKGLTNKEIAVQLAMSRNTVGGHLRTIFRVYGINSRTMLSGIVAEEDNRGEP
jgi:DNA-binding CsgD family transcriptional regulator